jgi:hypothetical protein
LKLLVFQHIACEHPGSLRQFLGRDGIESEFAQALKGLFCLVFGKKGEL